VVVYPWQILSVGSALYILSLPLGYKSYRNQAARYAGSSGATAGPVGAPTPAADAPVTSAMANRAGEERPPERLH
jgi:CDP-diacylglycerol--serine O-phosphatidyltransferase